MFPQFLGIGAPKAGTTWLHENLQRHPQIWLPPKKELDYFNHEGSASLSGRIHLFRRLIKWSFLRLIFLRGSPEKLWNLRYRYLPRTDAWYASLFPEKEGVICGEITPTYARLDDETIRKIQRLTPEAKIIYILRNPMERAWSQAGMMLAEYPTALDKMPESTVIGTFLHPRGLRNGDYLGNLARWEKHFPARRIFVGFLEEIQNRPEELLTRIYKFLGVDASRENIPDSIDQKVNIGSYGPLEQIPDRYLPYLARLYIDPIAGLHNRFNNAYTEDWLRLAEKGLRLKTHQEFLCPEARK